MTPPASQADLHVGGVWVSWAPPCETHSPAYIILYSLMHLSVPLLHIRKIKIANWILAVIVYCAEIDWTFWLASIIIVWISVWLCSQCLRRESQFGWCEGDTFTWLVVGSSVAPARVRVAPISWPGENTKHTQCTWTDWEPSATVISERSGCFDVLVSVGTPPSSQWEYYDLFSIPATYYPRCCQYWLDQIVLNQIGILCSNNYLQSNTDSSSWYHLNRNVTSSHWLFCCLVFATISTQH